MAVWRNGQHTHTRFGVWIKGCREKSWHLLGGLLGCIFPFLLCLSLLNCLLIFLTKIISCQWILSVWSSLFFCLSALSWLLTIIWLAVFGTATDASMAGTPLMSWFMLPAVTLQCCYPRTTATLCVCLSLEVGCSWEQQLNFTSEICSLSLFLTEMLQLKILDVETL